MRRATARLRAAALALSCVAVAAARPTTRPESFGTAEREIAQLWERYLRSKGGRIAAGAGTPSPYWSAQEQARWPMYDLAGFYLPDGAVPGVARITRVTPTGEAAYRIVTPFRSSPSTAGGSAGAPVLTMTVYARREGPTWVLANALPYHTADWTHVTQGRITYHVAPTRRFDRGKAAQAVAFVDSLASAYGVEPPASLDYYVAESVDEAMLALGVSLPDRFGPTGGFSKPVNRQVFSGIPAQGENYRHELAHVVLLPIIRSGTTSLLASEGVATWLGGTAGRDYRGSVRHLATRLAADPRLTLSVIVDDLRLPSDVRNAAGAVLAEMVHESGGVEAVREFLRSSGTPGVMRATLERLLRRPWSRIVEDWGRRVARA